MYKDSLLFASVPNTKSYYASKNYGVHRVASEFRTNNLTCQVIHFFNRFTDHELDLIIKKYVSSDSKIIGFSTMFWEHYDEKEKTLVLEKSKYIAVKIKKTFPNIKIIAGGPSCRLFLSNEFEGLVDAIFEGFSENDFIDYVISIKNNKLIKFPNKKINNVSVYSNIYGSFDFTTSYTRYEQEDFLTATDVPTLEVGRGCIFKCEFCGFALNGKKKFDYIKDPTVLKHELERNYKNFGITNYILSDDTFNDSTHKIKLLHQIFTNLPFKIKFSCYLRLDLLRAHPEQIVLLKEMGLIGAFFGIETFHPESAKLIGKGLDPDIAKQMIQDLKLKHWGNKIKIGIGLIVGLPYEPYESYEKTIEWILSEDNLADQIVPFPLTVNNPERMRASPWDSEFQKNFKKYGFSWPNNHEYEWINSKGPVTSRKEAEEIYKKYSEAVTKSSRRKQGGFNLSKAYPLISFQKDAPTIDQLLDMDRFSYTKYIKNLEKDLCLEYNYVETYKRKILL